MNDAIFKKTTMIGSLPALSADDALALLDKYPLSLPGWPQLPKRAFREGMIPQYSEGFPGIRIDDAGKKIWLERSDVVFDEMALFYEEVLAQKTESFAITESFAAGFHGFCRKLASSGKKIPAVKGQVTGPFTFGLGINDEEGKPLWFDEQYRDIVIKGLLMKAAWQIGQLQRFADQVIIFFDEPIFSALGTPGYLGIQDDDVVAALDELSDGCHERGALAGVHCCGNMDWALLSRTRLDIIAFDAYYFGDKLALYPEALNGFLSRGSILAWGIVPTNDPEKLKKETTETLAGKFRELFSLFVQKGISEELLKNNILFTPSCGMGSLKPDEAELVLRLLCDFK